MSLVHTTNPALSAIHIAATTLGPTGEKVIAEYGISTKKGMESLAIIEMAAASGLSLVPKEHRNPLHTTSRFVAVVVRWHY